MFVCMYVGGQIVWDRALTVCIFKCVNVFQQVKHTEAKPHGIWASYNDILKTTTNHT
jgi:hypothetical protein